MINDLPIILYWWFVLSFLGVFFLPFTFKIFHIFHDKGYVFSKIISLAVISYVMWIAGELKIMSFSFANMWLAVLLLAGMNLYIPKKYARDFIAVLRDKRKIIIFEESIFFAALLIGAVVRGFEPRIEGLEKFMDIGFINSILRSQYFPPQDMWLSGSTINYYYFGHLMAAVLTKISLIPSSLSYNLIIATMFAMTFTATFSLASNLIYFSLKKITSFEGFFEKIAIGGGLNVKNIYAMIGGLVSAFILTMAGNFEHLYYFFTHNNSFVGYWYPVAVRFIPYTISDFPMYSFATAYFHELISLPFVLLAIAVIYVLFEDNFDMRKMKKSKYYRLIFFSWILSVIYMTNTSDWMIYFLFITFLSGILGYFFYDLPHHGFKNMFAFLVSAGGISLFFMSPFFLDFKPFVKGISWVRSGSTLFELFILWGFFAFVAGSFMIRLALLKMSKRLGRKKAKIQIGASEAIVRTDLFILAMMIFSFFLIVIPEIIYIRDIYEATHPRSSTMYKLVYQSWMMLSLSTGYVLIRWLTFRKRKIMSIWLGAFVLLFMGVMIYPNFAIKSYYHDLIGYKGLMGWDWMRDQYPDDYSAVMWIDQNIGGQPVIIEAAGDDFTHFGRISANTGLLNIINWPSHEWLWRGSYDEPGKRMEEVRTIYESYDMEKLKALLEKYKAEYIIVGSLEKQQYSALNEQNIRNIGVPVFVSGGTVIYKIDYSVF